MTNVKEAAGHWGGVAQFSGVVAWVRSPVALVNELLPAPLVASIAPGSKKAGNEPPHHLLVFLFGELSGGGAHVGGRDFSAGVRYREALVMVPRVRHPEHEHDTLFACEMFADDPGAVLLGNVTYGFRKQLARIEWSGQDFAVHVGAEPRFVANGTLHGTWEARRPGSGSDVGLSELCATPVLGLRSTGEYVLSRFAWDLSDASFSAIAVDLKWRPRPSAPLFAFSADESQAVAVRGLCWRTSPPARLA